MVRILVLLLFGCISLTAVWGQECFVFYETGDCMKEKNPEYRIFSQSRSSVITVSDTIRFSIVFYGRKDYICSFCTQQDFYPINFQLIDPETNDILYDNKLDNYISSLQVGFDLTRTLIIQVSILEQNVDPAQTKSYTGCVGLLVQYKDAGIGNDQ